MFNMSGFSNVEFEDKGNKITVQGLFKNNSSQKLKRVFAVGRFKDSTIDILLFPSLNLGKQIDVIGPFEEVEFSHLLTTGEAEEARAYNFEGFAILSVDADDKTLFEKSG